MDAAINMSMDDGSLTLEQMDINCRGAGTTASSNGVTHGVPLHWELLIAMQQSQDKCTWAATEEVPDIVGKVRAYADWPVLLAKDPQPVAPSTEKRQQSSLVDIPTSLSTPLYLQSLLSREAHWKKRRALENASESQSTSS